MHKKLYTLVLLLLLGFSAFPQETYGTERKVRVAFLPDMYGFYNIEENGSYSGYNYDYLMNLLQFTEWDYEFVLIEEGLVSASLLKAQEMLKNGEIDLLGPFSASTPNLDEFEVGEKNYGVYRYNLYSARNNYAIHQDNYFLQEELSVALVESYTDLNNTFLTLMEESEIDLDVHYVENHSETHELLFSEEVDVLINLDMSINSEFLDYLSTIQRIPFYFVSTKGNTELIAELDEAILNVEIVEPSIHQTLLQKYFGTRYRGEFLFTDDEKQALELIDVFRVGLLSNEPPYQYIDEYGNDAGITLDILDRFEEILDVSFEIVWFDSEMSLLNAISAEEIDIIGTVPTDFTLSNFLSVRLTNPYLSSSSYWLRSTHEIENPDLIYHFVSSNIPFYHADQLSTTQDILGDLKKMDEDGTTSIYCDPYIAEYYLGLYQFENVEVKSVTDVLSEISFGVADHIDVNVVGMMNRGILYLEPSEVDEIVYKHTSVKPEYTFLDFFYDNAYKINAVILFLGSCVVLSIYNTSKRFKDLSRRDSLTKLYNSGYFHEYVEKKALHSSHGALVLIDIDYFKAVNDNHGHHTGDEVIKQVAKNMMKFYDGASFNARVGGDEFAVFIEGATNKKELMAKTDSFVKAMAHNESGIVTTLSIGGYIFDRSEEYKTLYKNADLALYKVKEQGRNAYLFAESMDDLDSDANRVLSSTAFSDKANHFIQCTNPNSKHGLLYISLDNDEARTPEITSEMESRIFSQVRQCDFISHNEKGDILLFLESCSSEKQASECAERIKSELEKPFSLNSKEISFKTKIDISLYPVHGQSYEDLLHNLKG